MENDHTRKTTQNIYQRLILFGLLSLLLAVVGYLLIVYLGFPAFSRIASGMTWDLFDVFTSLLSLSLFAGGFTFALAEYIDTEKAKQDEKNKLSYEIYNSIYHKLTDPEQEAARRWILVNITIKGENEDIESWYKKSNAKIMKATSGDKDGPSEGQNAIKLTLNCFDYIGFIAKNYWVLEDDSLNWISAPIAKVWRRIGPYVEHVRMLRNTTDYYLFAEHIGKLCIEYRKNKGMADEEIAKNTP